MGNHIKWINLLNKSIFILYGLVILFNMIQSTFKGMITLYLDLLISAGIFIYMDQKMKNEPIMHRSPKFYYTFVFLTTFTIMLDGGHQSFLFPGLFVFPVLYTSINFPRRGSTGIAVLSITIIWLYLFQDPFLTKINQVFVVSIFLIIIAQVVGLYIKKVKRDYRKTVLSNRYSVDD